MTLILDQRGYFLCRIRVIISSLLTIALLANKNLVNNLTIVFFSQLITFSCVFLFNFDVLSVFYSNCVILTVGFLLKCIILTVFSFSTTSLQLHVFYKCAFLLDRVIILTVNFFLFLNCSLSGGLSS
jgi:hypothetical protein